MPPKNEQPLRESIELQISQIRDLINRPRKLHLLSKNDRLWYQLCSCLDVVQDTDIAMEAYVQNAFPDDDGEKYIRVYGILQVLVVQQDATKHLITSLGLPSLIHHPLGRIRDIREVRIESIGHPTDTKIKVGRSYHSLSRVTMHKEGFHLLSYREGQPVEFKDINIPGLIIKQRQVISGILNQILDELTKQEQEHKEKFKKESLADILGKNQPYIISKVWEVIHSDQYDAGLGLTHMELIQESLESFKQALEKRDLWGAYYPIQYIYKEMEYSISEVKKYFQGENNLESATDRARVNFFFIDKHLEKLEQIAKEIDEEYGMKEDKTRKHPKEEAIQVNVNIISHRSTKEDKRRKHPKKGK